MRARETRRIMKRTRLLIVAVLTAGALGVGAAPANASCETEIGDWCKFMDFVCGTYPKVTETVIAYCRG